MTVGRKVGVGVLMGCRICTLRKKGSVKTDSFSDSSGGPDDFDHSQAGPV